MSRSFHSPLKHVRTAARSNWKEHTLFIPQLPESSVVGNWTPKFVNRNPYFVSVLFVISQSFVNSMKNAKFCLLPQTAFAMLNTTSQLLMVRRTVPESCQGSEYGQFPDL